MDNALLVVYDPRTNLVHAPKEFNGQSVIGQPLHLLDTSLKQAGWHTLGPPSPSSHGLFLTLKYVNSP